MKKLDWILLILLSLCWGNSFAINEILLEDLPPFSIVWARQITAFLLFVPISLPYLRKVHWNFNLFWRFAVMGTVAIALPFSLFALGQQYITSVLAGIGNATVPLYTMLLAAIFLTDEKITRNGFLGLLCGFLGILVLFLPMLSVGDFASAWGFTLAVLASGLYGYANVFARSLPVIPLRVQALLINGFAALALTPAMLWEAPDFTNLPMHSYGFILTHGLLGSFFAYLLYLKLIKRVGSVNTAQVAYLIPFTALFLGAIGLNEPVSLHALFALGLVLFGLWLKDRSQKNAPVPPSARDV